MNAGAIAGIVVGVLVSIFICLFAVGTYVLFAQSRKAPPSNPYGDGKNPFTHSGGTLPIVVVNQNPNTQQHSTCFQQPSGHGGNHRELNFGNGENGPTLTVQTQHGDNLTMIPVRALRHGGPNPIVIPNWGRRSERKSQRSSRHSSRRNQRSKSSTA